MKPSNHPGILSSDSSGAILLPEADLDCLRKLYGEGVLVGAARIQPDTFEQLFEEEQQLVYRAVSKRRYEFATGRVLARELLSQLGFPPCAILQDKARAPIWPSGIVGSISHSDEICVAVVTTRDRAASLAIDLEPRLALESKIWSHICVPQELDWLSNQPKVRRGMLARMIFNAKEAVYKAIYPLPNGGKFFDFLDVSLEFDQSLQHFEARGEPVSQNLNSRAHGFCYSTDQWLFAGMNLRATLVRPKRTP